MDAKKEEQLKKISKKINENLKKKDAVIFLGDGEIPEIERFSSGSKALDEALGGGWPVGRFSELFGGPSCGKSTICYHSIAEFQKKYPDKHVALVDTEGCFKEGTLIYDPVLSKAKTVEELFREGKEFNVRSVDFNTGAEIVRQAVMSNTGQKNVYKITLSDGRSVSLTANHKVLVNDFECKKVEDLSITDYMYSFVSDHLPLSCLRDKEIVKAMSINSDNRFFKFGIKSIEQEGVFDTYDVHIQDNNFDNQWFSAGDNDSGIIVHNSWDLSYAKTLGVDVESVLVHQPDDGEEAVNVIMQLIDAGVGLIIIDSVAALAVRAETENDFGETTQGMGAQARLYSNAFRRLSPLVAKSQATLLLTNQTRKKIGIVYGNPESTPGGEALKFYASVRVSIRSSVEKAETGEDPTSIRCTAKVIKNKTAIPFREAIYSISFGRGVDAIADLLDKAFEQGVVTLKGSWIKFGEESMCQGRKTFLEALREDEELQQEIQKALDDKKKEEKELKTKKPAKINRKAALEEVMGAEDEADKTTP